jgi:hypothetical protein
LKLGTDDDWLSLAVEDSKRRSVPKLASLPVRGEFQLEHATTGIKRVDITPCFDITQPDRYYLTATLMVPEWRQVVSSKPVTFDVTRGSTLWEQDFGMPGSGPDPSAPEIRRYALLQTLHSQKIRLYVRLTDSLQRQIFRVLLLGQMVSFSNPEPQVDRFSNLHVLYQGSGRSFVHCLINPDGVLIARETYDYTSSRPVLRAESDGRIAVVGGARRLTPTDVPAPPSPSPLPNAKPQEP